MPSILTLTSKWKMIQDVRNNKLLVATQNPNESLMGSWNVSQSRACQGFQPHPGKLRNPPCDRSCALLEFVPNSLSSHKIYTGVIQARCGTST